MVTSEKGEIMHANNTVKLPQHDTVLVLRGSLLKLVNHNHIAAAFLNQILYWRDIMGKTFYKTDEDFAEELHISIHKFRRIKRNIIKHLPFIKVTLKQIPARTHYEIDFDMLNAMLADDQDPPPLQPTKVDRLANTAQTTVAESAQSITETKSEITKKQTHLVVVNLDIFAEKEKQAANKFLSTIPHDQQIAVLAVMIIAIASSNISNKVGYLRAIINAVHNGTFTPVPKEKPQKPLTSSQIMQREKQRKQVEDIRHQVNNDHYFADIEAKYGKTNDAKLKRMKRA